MIWHTTFEKNWLRPEGEFMVLSPLPGKTFFKIRFLLISVFLSSREGSYFWVELRDPEKL